MNYVSRMLATTMVVVALWSATPAAQMEMTMTMTMPPADLCAGAPDATIVAAGTTLAPQGDVTYGCLGVHGTLDLSGIRTLTVRTLHEYPDGTVRLAASATRREVIVADVAPTDPNQFHTGLVLEGRVEIAGALKTAWTRLTTELSAGQSTITVADATGWQVGDTIVVVDSRDGIAPASPPMQPETFTIAAISGLQVALDHPAAHDAPASRAGDAQVLERFAPVANLSRSTAIKSANPDGTRGHVMLTRGATGWIRNVEFRDLGRTMLGPLNTTTNIKGRYPLHVHFMDNPGFELRGNSIAHGLKWGLVVHHSNGETVADNVVLDTLGAGFMTEDGSEADNVIDHNLVISVDGTRPAYPDPILTGMGGYGFWFQGPLNLVTRNVAANIARDGLLQWDDGSAHGPIKLFKDNETVGSGIGFSLWNQGSFTADSVVENFYEWHTAIGFYLYPHYRTTLLNWVGRGDPRLGGATGYGGTWGDYTTYTGDRLINPDIQGKSTGLFLPYGNNSGSWVGERVTTIEGGLFAHNKVALYTNSPIGGGYDPTLQQPFRTVVYGTLFSQNTTDIKRDFVLFQGNPLSQDFLDVANYNGVAGDSFRVYYTQSAPEFAMPSGPWFGSKWPTGPDYTGLTNAQMTAQYGVAIGGQIAPCADTRPGILGFTCSSFEDLPPPPPPPTSPPPVAPPTQATPPPVVEPAQPPPPTLPPAELPSAALPPAALPPAALPPAALPPAALPPAALPPAAEIPPAALPPAAQEPPSPAPAQSPPAAQPPASTEPPAPQQPPEPPPDPQQGSEPQPELHAVSDLKAEHRKGQTFITFTKPANATSNTTYDIFVSGSPITSLTGATKIATVDAESWHLRYDDSWPAEDVPKLSQGFVITDDGPQLTSSQGLLVWTPAQSGSVYYAVVAKGSSEFATVGPVVETRQAVPGWVRLRAAFPIGGGTAMTYKFFRWEDYATWRVPVWGYYGHAVNVIVPVPYAGSPVAPPYPVLVILHSASFGFQLPGESLSFLPHAVYIATRDIGLDSWMPEPYETQRQQASYGHSGWQGRYDPSTNELVLITENRVAAYAQLVRDDPTFNVDANRIYAEGASLGSMAAQVVAHRPDIFAAAEATLQIHPSQQMWAPPGVLVRGSTRTWEQHEDLGWLADHGVQMPPVMYTFNKNDMTAPAAWILSVLPKLEAAHQPYAAQWGGGGEPYGHAGFTIAADDSHDAWDLFRFMKNEARPAFANASSSSPYSTAPADPSDPYFFGQRNVQLDWQSALHTVPGGQPIADTANVFEITVTSTAGIVTADVTLGNFQHFHPAPGAIVQWSTQTQSGQVAANADGTVTLLQLTISSSGTRISLW